MNSFKNKNGIKLSNVYVLNNYLLSECLSKARCDFISKTLLEDGLHDKKAVGQEGTHMASGANMGKGKNPQEYTETGPGITVHQAWRASYSDWGRSKNS